VVALVFLPFLVLVLLHCAGRVVLNEFATPPQGLLGYAQQV
jgi:hypothetical protein